MLLQFTVVADNSIWIVDTQHLYWARVSAPPVPGDDSASLVLENGRLAPKGFGIYGLDRDPKIPEGAGLLTFGVYVVGIGTTVKIFLRANVEIKDFTMPAPIKQILYEILPTDPKQIEHSIQEMQDSGEEKLLSSPSEQEPNEQPNQVQESV